MKATFFSNLRIITSIFSGVRIFRNFTVDTNHHFSKHVKSRQACGEIEDSIKTWARGFVQDLLVKFRSYRDSTAEGCMTFQMTWFEVMDWVHEVMFKMTTCVVYKKKHKLFQQGTMQI